VKTIKASTNLLLISNITSSGVSIMRMSVSKLGIFNSQLFQSSKP
jgi:hypothetical protein